MTKSAVFAVTLSRFKVNNELLVEGSHRNYQFMFSEFEQLNVSWVAIERPKTVEYKWDPHPKVLRKQSSSNKVESYPHLTLSRRRPLSYRNQCIGLVSI